SQRARPRNLKSLRVCLTGADVCPIDLQERVTSTFGAPLYNIWGATEVVGSLTFGLQPGPVVRIGEGALIRLIDENGADVADDEVGELLIRGANVFDGYWNDPQATAESLKAGWYHSGDLMRRGEGDELWFVSRKKDIIIRGGTNISPVEVEQALVACHPVVEQGCGGHTGCRAWSTRVRLCEVGETDNRHGCFRNPPQRRDAACLLQGPRGSRGTRRIAPQRAEQGRSQRAAGHGGEQRKG